MPVYSTLDYAAFIYIKIIHVLYSIKSLLKYFLFFLLYISGIKFFI